MERVRKSSGQRGIEEALQTVHNKPEQRVGKNSSFKGVLCGKENQWTR